MIPLDDRRWSNNAMKRRYRQIVTKVERRYMSAAIQGGNRSWWEWHIAEGDRTARWNVLRMVSQGVRALAREIYECSE